MLKKIVNFCFLVFLITCNSVYAEKKVTKPQYLCKVQMGEISRCESGPKADCWFSPIVVESMEVSANSKDKTFELPEENGYMQVQILIVKFSSLDKNFDINVNVGFFRTKKEANTDGKVSYYDKYDSMKIKLQSETYPELIKMTSFGGKALECKLVN